MKILVALPRFPHPIDKGDKLRAFNQIRCLSQHHDIYLFCTSDQWVSDDDFHAVEQYCKAVKVVHYNKLGAGWNVLRALFSIKSLQVGYWTSKRTIKKFRKFEKKVQPDVLYCQMIRTMEWVKGSSTPKVLDFQDSLSKNIERRMYHSRFWWRRVLHYEFKMVRSCEYDAFDIFDAFTIISETDKDVIPHRRSDEIVVVPNGIDTTYFAPQDAEKRYDIVFCGNMKYAPNVDAAKFLVNDIMPLVWKTMPEARVLISGTNPAKDVKRLAGEHVTVSGRVDDIRQSYAHSRLFVAPMRMGSGMQNKLLEAMAMRLPCITTTIAGTPLGVHNGQQLIVADNVAQIAEKIVELLKNQQLSNEIAQNGYNYVTANFDWEKRCAELENVLSNTVNNQK